jgi:hypothetical protein
LEKVRKIMKNFLRIASYPIEIRIGYFLIELYSVTATPVCSVTWNGCRKEEA